MVLTCLFGAQSLIWPRKCMPWSTPDKGNYERWYWVFARQRFVFVPRGKGRGEVRALGRVVKLLKAESRVIMFPEGGRTSRGATHYTSTDGTKMRDLRGGTARAALEAGADILPVWISDAEQVLPVGCFFPRIWRPMTITVGRRIPVDRVSTHHKQELRGQVDTLTETLTQALLDLSV